MNPAACSWWIHSSYGSRVNRAWGVVAAQTLSCRTFNFELQAGRDRRSHRAVASRNAHSFELSQARPLLEFEHGPAHVLVQALCAAADVRGCGGGGPPASPLALPRFSGRQEDSGTDRADERGGPAGVPCFPTRWPAPRICPAKSRFPITHWCGKTIRDCLEERDGCRHARGGIAALGNRPGFGSLARDLTEPSPLALEALKRASPMPIWTTPPLEERRTQAVMARRWIDAGRGGRHRAAGPGSRRQGSGPRHGPDAATGDELCDALSWLTFLSDSEVSKNHEWPRLIGGAHRTGAGKCVSRPPGHRKLWVNTDQRGLFEPQNAVLGRGIGGHHSRAARGAGAGNGRAAWRAPGSVDASAAPWRLAAPRDRRFLRWRGRFTSDAAGEEWCERRLAGAHPSLQPSSGCALKSNRCRHGTFCAFLFDWQRVLPEARLAGVGCGGRPCWRNSRASRRRRAGGESDILPAPNRGIRSALAGRALPRRPLRLGAACRARRGDQDLAAGPIRTTPITLLARRNAKVWSELGQPT